MKIEINENGATIEKGRIKAVFTPMGKLSFYNTEGKLLLKEYYRSMDYDIKDCEDLDQIVSAKVSARTYKNVGGDNYHITMRFESDDQEMIFGMGQYQIPYLNLKGCCLEMAQRNTQICVPFAVSNIGYGLLWNNPGIGTALFGNNLTQFEVLSSKQIDYWITAGQEPAQI